VYEKLLADRLPAIVPASEKRLTSLSERHTLRVGMYITIHILTRVSRADE